MRRLLTIGLLLMTLAAPAAAGVMAASTRVVYPAGEREKSLMLVNTNNYPVIVQSWVDDGTGNPDTANAPFVVIPSVFRLAPNAVQGIRLLFSQTPLPKDRESVFWLNLYEIPPINGSSADTRRVTFAMNTQMKIFYRPKELVVTLDEALSKLVFRLRHDPSHWWIECENPTPLHISLTALTIQNGAVEKGVERQMDMMIAPFSKKKYAFSGTIGLAHPQRLQFSYLDDAGVQHVQDAALQEIN